MPATRAYTAGNFALILGTKTCGLLRSVSGGGIYAEVISEPGKDNHITRKNLSNVRYGDLSFEVGFAAAKELWDWIAASWSPSFVRQNGSITICDSAMEAKSTREFFNALVTETTFPTLDASSKDPGFVKVKVSPELLRMKKASGKIQVSAEKTSTKLFLPRNFRL